MNIKKVVVIGSGTMGSGIAAQVANAGLQVNLIDISTEIATNAYERIIKSRPPLLMEETNIAYIQPGNIEDDIDIIKEADWVVEAVVERLDIKKSIYEKIDGKGEGFSELNDLACEIYNKLGDKEWAKKIYKEAEENAENCDDYESLAESVRDNLGDKKWAKLLEQQAKELEEENDDEDDDE